MNSLQDYLCEGKKIQVKRKYGKYNEITVGNTAPTRNKILSYIGQKESCTLKEIKDYIKSKNEELGTSINTNWLNKNKKYLKKSTVNVLDNKGTKYNQTIFKLSKLGKRVLNKAIVNED